MNDLNVQPITLTGTHVRLEPLALKYADDLFQASQFPEIWELTIALQPKSLDEMRTTIESDIASTAARKQIWFASIRRADNRAVGMTSYLDIRLLDRGLEIGGTWLTPSAWRTAINTECKYLLLKHAFEELGCIRVQLKTDERNLRSQRAIERLGAVREGLLRKYQIVHDGYQRNTVMYSIIDLEWARVKARLERFLKQGEQSSVNRQQ